MYFLNLRRLSMGRVFLSTRFYSKSPSRESPLKSPPATTSPFGDSSCSTLPDSAAAQRSHHRVKLSALQC